MVGAKLLKILTSISNDYSVAVVLLDNNKKMLTRNLLLKVVQHAVIMSRTYFPLIF